MDSANRSVAMDLDQNSLDIIKTSENTSSYQNGVKIAICDNSSAGRSRVTCSITGCTSQADKLGLCPKHLASQRRDSAAAFNVPGFSSADEGLESVNANATLSSNPRKPCPEATAFQKHMDFNRRLNEIIKAETIEQNKQQAHLYQLFHTAVLPVMWSKTMRVFDSDAKISFGLERSLDVPLHEHSLPPAMELLIDSHDRHVFCVNGKPVIPSQTSVRLPKLCRPFTRDNIAEVLATLAHLYAPCGNNTRDSSGKCELLVRNTRSVCPSCKNQQRAQRRCNGATES